MGWSVDARNGMLTQVRARITVLSIHTADPGATGTNEVSGGGYARVAATVGGGDFSAVAAGAYTLAVTKAFVAAAATTATFFGAWDGATWLGGGAITGDTAFNAEGDFNLLSGTSFDLT